MRNGLALILASLAVVVACGRPEPRRAQKTDSPPRQRQIDKMLERWLATPQVTAEPGFTASVLVPPGELYDPLGILPRDDNTAWVSDDGGENDTGTRGGRIWAIDAEGGVSILVDVDRLFPVTGLDVAPAGFGRYGGQIFAMTQPRATIFGTYRNHLIQSVDPRNSEDAKPLCTLPAHGTVNGGLPGGGYDARFGPAGSPFANRLFSVSVYNWTIYQTTADGVCTPFATFDGVPFGITFSADGSRMLVAVTRGQPGRTSPEVAPLPPPRPPGDAGPTPTGTIVAVAADGTMDQKPLFEAAGYRVSGIAIAPPTFAPYGGQIFFTGSRIGAQAGSSTGGVFRITPDGTAHLVASGRPGPVGIGFMKDSIWVTSVNGDFVHGPLAGNPQLPDGSIVKISRQ